MKIINRHELKTPAADGYVGSLLRMDSRIKVYQFFGDVTADDSGYIPTKTQLLFPTQLPRASHEIAHMVEMNSPKRWTQIDWGFSLPNRAWKSKGGFFAALSREIRVVAIEKHMNPELSELGPLRNEHYWVPESKKKLPFGRFKSYQDLVSWALDLSHKTHAAWSLDRIRHEWQVRLNHIQNWMETT